MASTTGLVTSGDATATRIGVEVLERGGNAVDAAVATAFALAVTYPQAGSLGGGGFAIVRLASGQSVAIDYREICPAEANAQTNAKQLAQGGRGYGSAPVPGVAAGLELLHRRFGSRPWGELVEPAVRLARDGHPLSARASLVLGWHYQRIKDPTFRAIFGHGGKALAAGQRLRQPALAKTLQAIAERGAAGFYQGDTAAKLERAMRANGGHVRATDLNRYEAREREPLRLLYRGLEIATMPPPSMGGVALASIMLQLETARAWESPQGSAASLHLFAEAARRAYADRRAVAGDPAFVDAAAVGPLLDRLLDPRYHAERVPRIDPSRATRSSELVPLDRKAVETDESPDTTHLSVVDGAGNAVALTTTLSGAFGAQVVPPDTGVIVSNALGAFSPSGVNTMAPGKRMASSMTPTIVLQDGHPVAVLGSPGGDTIPNTVAQVLRNLADYGMTVDAAIEAPRLHQQFRPDELRIERPTPPPPAVVRELEKRGHKIVRHVSQGHVNCIVIDASTRTAYGAFDPREGGLAAAPKAIATPSADR